MWQLGTDFSAGLGSAGLMGFNDLRELFQPNWFYDLWKTPDPNWVWVTVALLTTSCNSISMLSTWGAGFGDGFVWKGGSWDVWRGQCSPGHHSHCRARSCSPQHFLPAGQTPSCVQQGLVSTNHASGTWGVLEHCPKPHRLLHWAACTEESPHCTLRELQASYELQEWAKEIGIPRKGRVSATLYFQMRLYPQSYVGKAMSQVDIDFKSL